MRWLCSHPVQWLSCNVPTGYFRANGANSGGMAWQGAISQLDLSTYPPDVGPAAADPAAGVVTLGAVPWGRQLQRPTGHQ